MTQFPRTPTRSKTSSKGSNPADMIGALKKLSTPDKVKPILALPEDGDTGYEGRMAALHSSMAALEQTHEPSGMSPDDSRMVSRRERNFTGNFDDARVEEFTEDSMPGNCSSAKNASKFESIRKSLQLSGSSSDKYGQKIAPDLGEDEEGRKKRFRFTSISGVLRREMPEQALALLDEDVYDGVSPSQRGLRRKNRGDTCCGCVRRGSSAHHVLTFGFLSFEARLRLAKLLDFILVLLVLTGLGFAGYASYTHAVQKDTAIANALKQHQLETQQQAGETIVLGDSSPSAEVGKVGSVAAAAGELDKAGDGKSADEETKDGRNLAGELLFSVAKETSATTAAPYVTFEDGFDKTLHSEEADTRFIYYVLGLMTIMIFLCKGCIMYEVENLDQDVLHFREGSGGVVH